MFFFVNIVRNEEAKKPVIEFGKENPIFHFHNNGTHLNMKNKPINNTAI